MSTFEYYLEESDIYCKYAKGKPTVNGQEFHDFDEFIMFLGGSANFISKDTQTLLTPYDLVWVPREQFHQFVVSDAVQYTRCIVSVKRSSPLYQILATMSKGVSVGHASEKIQSIFGDIITAMTSTLSHQEKTLLIRALITQIVFEKKLSKTISKSVSDPSSLVGKAIAYIDENLKSDLTLKKIACFLYVSESTLSHKFHKELNISVYHYITKKRLSMVRQYVSSGYSIGQAATLSGFNNYASLFRVCKSHYGINPSQFLYSSD